MHAIWNHTSPNFEPYCPWFGTMFLNHIPPILNFREQIKTLRRNKAAHFFKAHFKVILQSVRYCLRATCYTLFIVALTIYAGLLARRLLSLALKLKHNHAAALLSLSVKDSGGLNPIKYSCLLLSLLQSSCRLLLTLDSVPVMPTYLSAILFSSPRSQK